MSNKLDTWRSAVCGE